MSIGPRQIPRKGENYSYTKKVERNQESDILDYLPWFFIFRGWF